MANGRMVHLLCLDLDHTLIDTDRSMHLQLAAAAEAAKAARTSLTAEAIEVAIEAAVPLAPDVGRVYRFAEMLGIEGEKQVGAVVAAYWSVIPDVLELQDDAIATLKALRAQMKLVIITNGPSTRQRAKVDKFGLGDLVDGLVISEEVGVEKPDARIFAAACDLASIPADRAAHVGDSPRSDVLGARNAGMMSIWFLPTAERSWPRGLVADATIETLSELLPLLTR